MRPYLLSNQNKAKPHKQNVDEPVHPHPGCLTLPYNQTNQTPTYNGHLLFILTVNPFAVKLSDVFRINSKR